ncbi:hypothetical protein ACFL6L_04190 [candidate division KSB1 bacterium]
MKLVKIGKILPALLVITTFLTGNLNSQNPKFCLYTGGGVFNLPLKGFSDNFDKSLQHEYIHDPVNPSAHIGMKYNLTRNHIFTLQCSYLSTKSFYQEWPKTFNGLPLPSHTWIDVQYNWDITTNLLSLGYEYKISVTKSLSPFSGIGLSRAHLSIVEKWNAISPTIDFVSPIREEYIKNMNAIYSEIGVNIEIADWLPFFFGIRYFSLEKKRILVKDRILMKDIEVPLNIQGFEYFIGAGICF